MTRTFSCWVGGTIKLLGFYQQKLGDFPQADVVKEGGHFNETPYEFMHRHAKFFKKKGETRINFNAMVYVVSFELVHTGPCK